jgi:hypothetical protein
MTENTESTRTDNSKESGWVECPNGEISGMVKRVARQRSIAAAVRVSAVATVLLAGLGAWQFIPADSHQAAQPEGERQFGSICCSDVARYAAAFQKGELDAEKTAQIRQHVAECPHCGQAFEKKAAEPHTAIDDIQALRHVAILARTALIPGH